MRGVLAKASVPELVALFQKIALAEYDALFILDTRTYNKLYPKLKGVEAELKARPGDQRHALLPFYTHENIQVRLTAAAATIALAPDAALEVIQTIATSRIYPQAADAGSMLNGLKSGRWKPE